MDEAGFNLTKMKKRGRNVIGHHAIINVPGQRYGNITMCAAVSQNGVVHHHATLVPYNTAHFITVLDTLHDIFTLVQGAEQSRYVWDSISGCFGPGLGYRSPTLHCTQPPPLL